MTPARWTDIWLNEGFAVYASLLWDSHRGGPTPRQALEEVYAIPADDGYWSVLPGAEDLFAGAVYSRGALTLQALREEVGDEHFFAILRQWAARGGLVPVTTAEFVALSEQVSGRQLDGLFETWL